MTGKEFVLAIVFVVALVRLNASVDDANEARAIAEDAAAECADLRRELGR